MSQGNTFGTSEGQEDDCKPSAWIMKGKSINLIAFSEDMTGLAVEGRAVDVADEGRAMDVVYLDFS